MRFRSRGRSRYYSIPYRNTRRTGRATLRKRVVRLTRRIRRQKRDDFTRLKFTLFTDVYPQYDSLAEPVGGFAFPGVAEPSAQTAFLRSDPQYGGFFTDYESYAISRIKVTFIPHAQSAGSRTEGGGLYAIGIDPRGPAATKNNVNYNVETIGRWAKSKIRPNRDGQISISLSLRKYCNELSEAFWRKAGSSPEAYPTSLPYIAFAWFRAALSNNLSDGNNTYVGTLRTTYTVYFKNRLARA